MPRGSKKALQKCTKHEFLLRPSSDFVRHPHHLTLSFCSPQGERRSQSAGPVLNCVQAPAFNPDKSHASPAFVLPADQDCYRTRRDQMLKEHDMRFSNFTDQKTELNVPKPRTKNSFCNVCRMYYDDYLGHIECITHKRKIAASVFSRYINDLADEFYKKTGVDQKRNVKNQPQALIDDDSQDVEIISNPLKKVKTNETIMEPTSPSFPPRIRDTERENFPSSLFPNNYLWKTSMGDDNNMQGNMTFNYNMNFFMSPFNMINPMHMPFGMPFGGYQSTYPGFMPMMGMNCMGSSIPPSERVNQDGVLPLQR